MKVPSERVELVASKEKWRPVLEHVHLRIAEEKIGRGRNRTTIRRGFLEATDSYRAIRVPVEVSDDDTAGLIARRALEAARKEKAEEISTNGSTVVPVDGGQLELARPEGVWNDRMDRIFDFEGEPTFTIGLNAELLVGLAKALGASKSQGGVRLEFWGEHKPIRVTFDKNREAVGVLMPVRLA